MFRKIFLSTFIAVTAFISGTIFVGGQSENKTSFDIQAAQNCSTTDSRGSDNSSAYGWDGNCFPVRDGCYAVVYHCPNRTSITSEGCEENPRVIGEGGMACFDRNLPGVQQDDLVCVDSNGDIIPAAPGRDYSAFQSVAISCVTIPDATPAPTPNYSCTQNHCNPGGPWSGTCCSNLSEGSHCQHTWEEGFYAACYPATPAPTAIVAPTSVPTPNPTPAITPTATPTLSPTPSPAPTSTPIPEITPTPIQIAIISPSLQPTNTPAPNPTVTPTPIPTPTPVTTVEEVSSPTANPTPENLFIVSVATSTPAPTPSNIVVVLEGDEDEVQRGGPSSENKDLTIENDQNIDSNIKLALVSSVLAAETETADLGVTEMANTGTFFENLVPNLILGIGTIATLVGVRLRKTE